MTQLDSAFEFIENRMILVDPFLVFPFATVPERFNGKLVRIDKESVVLSGFAVWVFPTGA
jgi:hypothetical protein